MGYAERAVLRFWRNLENGLSVLIKDKTITKKTTVKELLKLSKKTIKGLEEKSK